MSFSRLLVAPLLGSFLLSGCTLKGSMNVHVLTFEKDIKILMTNYCFECHGPEAREADLDLGTVNLMLAGGESGPALVPGKPGESLLLDMVSEGHMPPEGEMLTKEEIDLLDHWISQGAN